MEYPWAVPLPIAAKVCAKSRAWSEFEAEPTAVERVISLAAIVSAVAPQAPFCGPAPKGSILQGPILQATQHIPSNPNPQCGFCASYLSQIVSIPSSFLALSIAMFALSL